MTLFQVYWNNRSNSYVKDSVLFLKPTLTEDRFGPEFIKTGHLDLWGGQPGDLCTMNQVFISYQGCQIKKNDATYFSLVKLTQKQIKSTHLWIIKFIDLGFKCVQY